VRYERRGVLFGAEIALFLLIGIAFLDAIVGGSEKTIAYVGKALSIPLLTGLLGFL